MPTDSANGHAAKPVRVMLVDDSIFVRRLIERVIAQESELDLVGACANGQQALDRLQVFQPDVIILDVEMPVMNGIETLKELRKRGSKLPVLMFSTLTDRGALTTIDALTAGASDYVAKPTNGRDLASSMEMVRETLVPKLKSVAGVGKRATAGGAAAATPVATRKRTQLPVRPDLVAIASSTGGPNALLEVMRALPPDLGLPIALVQHMPAAFTSQLAARLDACSQLQVQEAVDGEALVANKVYVAPGGRHLCVRRKNGVLSAELSDAEPVHFCRPAADVLFDSLVETLGSRVLVVVLTGMGHDGFEGAKKLADKGAQVIVQDQASSVVWGMPGIIARSGIADAVLPLSEMPREIEGRVRGGVRSTPNTP